MKPGATHCVAWQSLGLSLLAFVVLDKILVGAAGTLTEMPIVSIASACAKRRCPVPVQMCDGVSPFSPGRCSGAGRFRKCCVHVVAPPRTLNRRIV